ncbi:NADPH:quinone reductase [Goodfellowiella coeruleoviolacea]|uniref:NADPH:quinone reductase n=2 Tax=Goodfellowiella coeruleoviolacea TaxID=334858 RepID=A0AAE3GBK7_9PSEU|nr:NADPH:quinone reductase [Goodfellowiella coeruleoviolacea]
MRAIRVDQWGGPERLRLVEVDRPEPLPTEVQVRVHAAGVNPIDWYASRNIAYPQTRTLPFIPGWDVAGVVSEVGYGVTTLAPGDAVFGMPRFPHPAGGYAEYVTAPARHLCRIPAGLDFTEAAALPLAGLSAWQMLVDTADVRPGQRVLVTGAAGGVGHLAVQIAKARGAYVIGTASAGKHDFLRELGADEVIDYTTADVATAVHDIDVVIQMFGGPTGTADLRTLRPGGILVSAQGAWTPGLAEEAARLGVRATDFLVEPDQAGLRALAAMVEQGTLRVHVHTVLPLTQAASAHEVGSQSRTVGKTVLLLDH